MRNELTTVKTQAEFFFGDWRHMLYKHCEDLAHYCQTTGCGDLGIQLLTFTESQISSYVEDTDAKEDQNLGEGILIVFTCLDKVLLHAFFHCGGVREFIFD